MLRRLHRLTGLAAAALVLLLAVTGLLLNHHQALGLDRVAVAQPLLLGLWGIDGPQLDTLYPAGDHWLALAGGRLVLGTADTARAVEPAGALLGAVPYQNLIAALVPGRLLLLQSDGTLVDSLTPAFGLPRQASALGRTSDGRLVLATPAGNQVADATMASWQSGGSDAVWAQPGSATAAQADSARQAASEGLLDLERVVLDLHSLQVFGLPGRLANDLAALALVFLALSGVQMHLRRKRHRPATGEK